MVFLLLNHLFVFSNNRRLFRRSLFIEFKANLDYHVKKGLRWVKFMERRGGNLARLSLFSNDNTLESNFEVF